VKDNRLTGLVLWALFTLALCVFAVVFAAGLVQVAQAVGLL